MSLVILAMMALLLVPMTAWANRPYERYRRGYEAKYGVPLEPELDELWRESDRGERIDWLQRGPRVLVAVLRRRRGTRHDPQLERLRLNAVKRRNLVLAVFVLLSILMVLQPFLRPI